MTKNVRGWVVGGHQILFFLKTLFLFCVILPVHLGNIRKKQKSDVESNIIQ